MEIRTDIQIDAPAERVWAVLTDLDAYPDWNPLIRRARGQLARGRRLEVHMHLPGTRGWTMRPTVLNVVPGRELRWLGHVWVPGLFDGEHVFEIEPLDENSVRFVQRERFIGILVPFVRFTLGPRVVDGFEAMNEALKERAESTAPEAAPEG